VGNIVVPLSQIIGTTFEIVIPQQKCLYLEKQGDKSLDSRHYIKEKSLEVNEQERKKENIAHQQMLQTK
jgi:hypothetical protein